MRFGVWAFLLAGCDPLWGYRVTTPTAVADKSYYQLPGPSQTSLRVRASLFTSTLSTMLAIKNDGATTLTIHSDDVHVADRTGTELPRKDDRDALRCEGHPEDVIQLATGATCELRAELEVEPDASRLGTITMTLPGVTRDGAAVPISITFEKD